MTIRVSQCIDNTDKEIILIDETRSGGDCRSGVFCEKVIILSQKCSYSHERVIRYVL